MQNIFENHAAFNHYQSIMGMRVNESGTQPSIYIIERALKRTINEMSCENMTEILKRKVKLTPVGLEHHLDILLKKAETLKDFQYIEANRILTDIGRIECVEYIARCKKTDKENNHSKKLKK